MRQVERVVPRGHAVALVAPARELQALVAQWRLNIELGKLAARVLCEYIDSRIHCFDNTQDTHPQRGDGKLDRGRLTELAERQAERLVHMNWRPKLPGRRRNATQN